MVKVAITDLFPAHWHPRVAESAPAGWEYELASDLSLPNRARMVVDADVVFCGSATPTDDMLEAASQLRFVQKLGAGYDNINVDLCRSLGVGIARLNGNNSVAVAEHAIMLMLAVYRRLISLDAQVRGGGWGKDLARAHNRELRGKTVGIVGLGRIGREVAKRLRGFEVEVQYFDVVRAPGEVEEELGVRFVQLDDLFRLSDVVTLHLPVFPETRGLVSRTLIDSMRPQSILVNCGRGELVDEPALVDALAEGRISGAGLDCVAEERPGGSRAFWEMDNVVLTPHIAGVSEENFVTMMQRAFTNAEAYLAGQNLPPDDVIWVPAGPRT